MFSVGDSPGPGLETLDLGQYFSNLSWGPPSTGKHYVCLPHRSHQVQVLQTLLMSQLVELGVL